MAKAKKPIKNIWGALSVKLASIISGVLFVLILVATLVATCNDFLYGTICMVMGSERRVVTEGKDLYENYIRYNTEYKGKKDVLAAAEELNEQIVAEGITLLKNEDNVLPLAKNSKVTVFGKNSVDLVLGGEGSSAGSKGGNGNGLYDSLKATDIEYNDTMRTFYKSGKSGGGRADTPAMGSTLTGLPIGEAPIDATNGYSDKSVNDSIASYNDAALVVISREGGEGYDMPRTMFWNKSSGSYTDWNSNDVIPGARSRNDHYLELDKNEENMIRYASSKFENVILVINSSTPVELGFLDSGAYGNVKGAVWIGHTGGNGIKALGKVLTGDITPSGRTIDTYPADFTKDPTWNNFGNNMVGMGNAYAVDGVSDSDKIRFVEYEEGIYVGYRYYETRGFVEDNKQGATQGKWYDDNVVYPFGYGLSYTTFKQEIVSAGTSEEGELKADGTITVKVKVTNTGSKPGKEVVQLYYTPPYYDGGIEKSHVVLGAFDKTPTLYPADEANGSDKLNSCELTLTINVRDMASYDYNDANKNGFVGYETESGTYIVKLMKNAHEVIDSLEYTVPATETDKTTGYKYATDEVTNNAVSNLFDDVSSGTAKDGTKISNIEYMSRSDFEGSFPTTVTDRTLTVEQNNKFKFEVTDNPGDPWYSDTKPTQATEAYGVAPIQLYDMLYQDEDGKWHVYDFADGGEGEKKWKDLLDQLTVAEMKELVVKALYRTAPIDSIGKPLSSDGDGPVGHAVFMGNPRTYDVCYYASECVMAATWNTELAEAFGTMIGDEALIGNAKGDGVPYTGWYAPAVNIHRSQFSGRNYEYYSEDGFISGKMAAAVIRGAQSKGVITYVKHFAVNDQETDRDTTGLATWANEQSMREIYFLPFETAVKEGKSKGVMSSFNRLGTIWAGGSHDLLTKLLRDEWGFKGTVVTDYNLTSYMDVNQMVRAGGDTSLSASKPFSSKSATAQAQLRRATQNVLYTYASSNMMNGLGKGVKFGYRIPLWVELLIWLNVVVFVVGAGITTAMILLARRRLKMQNAGDGDGADRENTADADTTDASDATATTDSSEENSEQKNNSKSEDK